MVMGTGHDAGSRWGHGGGEGESWDRCRIREDGEKYKM